MSYPMSLDTARADIKRIEPDKLAVGESSKILEGQESGGPSVGGEIAPKKYTLHKAYSGKMRRRTTV